MTDAERIEDLTRERNQLLAANLVAKATIATLRSEHLANAFLRHAEALVQVQRCVRRWRQELIDADDAIIEVGRTLDALEDG